MELTGLLFAAVLEGGYLAILVKDFPPDRMISAAVIILVRCRCEAMKLDLVVGRDKALVENETGYHANGEGATAEAEAENLVGVALPVPADELVDVDDVAPQSDAEGAAEDGERFETRRANSVVIERNLIGTREIQRLEGPPNVRAPDGSRGISGAVGKHDDLPSHVSVPKLREPRKEPGKEQAPATGGAF